MFINKNFSKEVLYKNASNYLLQITENSIDFERNTEQFYNSKYFYKDGQYKKEMHSVKRENAS